MATTRQENPAPPHLLTQGLEMKSLQFVDHLPPPGAEPTIKVGRLEEMPLEREKHFQHHLSSCCLKASSMKVLTKKAEERGQSSSVRLKL